MRDATWGADVISHDCHESESCSGASSALTLRHSLTDPSKLESYEPKATRTTGRVRASTRHERCELRTARGQFCAFAPTRRPPETSHRSARHRSFREDSRQNVAGRRSCGSGAQQSATGGPPAAPEAWDASESRLMAISIVLCYTCTSTGRGGRGNDPVFQRPWIGGHSWGVGHSADRYNTVPETEPG